MARGVNKVILVGNLGDDPKVQYTQGGMAITTLSVATSSVRKDRDGNVVEKTEWHRVKCFGKLGEIAGEYLTKGRQVYVEGRLEYGSYEKDGVKHYTTDILADQLEMLGGGGEGGQERASSPRGGTQRGGGERSTGSRQPAPREAAERQQESQAKFDDVPFDDDIPFDQGNAP